MEKMDLDIYEDGHTVKESEIATAVAKLDNAVIFQNDAKQFFFLVTDPESIDIGTIAQEKDLMPIEVAEEPLRERIEAAVRGL